jgi:hypothetical protein
MKCCAPLLLAMFGLDGKRLRNILLVTSAACIVTFAALCQNNQPKYQDGTITSVVQHTETAKNDASVSRYDVSIKVGRTVYVVLYTPPNGLDTVKYKTGMNLLVLIEKDTVTFHDLLGRQVQVPILRRHPAPLQSSK